MGTTKLADFGIAKAAEQTRITQVGSVLGTAAYLSPEQARGEEAGPASDIYSLGRVRLPVPHRAAAARVRVADRAGAEAAAGSGRADHGATGRRCRPSWTRRCGCASSAIRRRATPSALEMAEAIEAGVRGEATDATQRLGMSDYDATEAIDETAATSAMPRTVPGPSPTRVHDARRRPAARRARSRRRARRRAARGAPPAARELPRPAGGDRGDRDRRDRAALVLERGRRATRWTRATFSSRSTGCATSSASTRAEHPLGLVARSSPGARSPRAGRSSAAP